MEFDNDKLYVSLTFAMDIAEIATITEVNELELLESLGHFRQHSIAEHGYTFGYYLRGDVPVCHRVIFKGWAYNMGKIKPKYYCNITNFIEKEKLKNKLKGFIDG